jgi:hypothetical protein
MQALIAPWSPLPERAASGQDGGAGHHRARGERALVGRVQARAAMGGTAAPRDGARRSRAAPCGGLQAARTLPTGLAA